MSQNVSKKRSRRNKDSYAALKSRNEIYFQMASVFKQVSKTQNYQAGGIVEKLFSNRIAQISLENSF